MSSITQYYSRFHKTVAYVMRNETVLQEWFSTSDLRPRHEPPFIFALPVAYTLANTMLTPFYQVLKSTRSRHGGSVRYLLQENLAS